MKRVLYYGDSPVSQTGFGQVSRHLLKGLHDTGKYEFDVVGINHHNKYYNRQEYPYQIYSPPQVSGNRHARMGKHLFSQILHESVGDYDYIFIHYDPGFYTKEHVRQIERHKEKGAKFVFYTLLDVDYVLDKQMRFFEIPDVTVVYSKFAYKLILEKNPKLENKLYQIGLGCDADYKPKDNKRVKDVRRQLFGPLEKQKDLFLITSINRHQFRKDLARLVQAYLVFHKQYPKTALYLHTPKSLPQGGDLPMQAECIRERLGYNSMADTNIIFAPYEDGEFVTREALNYIYCASDLIASTSKGEGWGLATTEAMRCKVPFIGPRNTTFPEILGKDEKRGYIVDTTDEWVVDYGQSNLLRNLTDIDKFANKLDHIYNNRQEAERKAHKAYKWTKQNLWKHKVKEWVELFAQLDSK